MPKCLREREKPTPVATDVLKSTRTFWFLTAASFINFNCHMYKMILCPFVKYCSTSMLQPQINVFHNLDDKGSEWFHYSEKQSSTHDLFSNVNLHDKCTERASKAFQTLDLVNFMFNIRFCFEILWYFLTQTPHWGQLVILCAFHATFCWPARWK